MPARFKFFLLGITLTLILLLTTGCGGTPKPKPRPWNLSITKQTPTPIEADVIGINQLEKQVWAGYSMDKYWKDPNSLRRDADKLTKLLETGKPWVISLEDAKWQVWKQRGVTELVIIADLPVRSEAGASDPRRVFIPLDKGAWDARDKTIEIQVQEGLIRVMTPQKL